MFVEVQVPSVPTALKVLEIELDADLWLGLPAGSHDIEVRVRSPGSSAWFAISGGKARSLTAVDTFVGATSATTEAGELVWLAVGTAVDSLRLECGENNGLLLGWVEAETIEMVGEGLLTVVGITMNPIAHVRTGSITVQSRRILVGSELYAGRVGKHTRITCETDDARVVVGDTLGTPEARYLTVDGGELKVVRGEVGPLHLNDVQVLEIGDVAEPTGDNPTLQAATRQAVASHLGYGLVTGVTGNVRELKLGERAAIAGDPKTGFSAQRIAAVSTAEISGLNARSFNLYSAGILRDVRRLGLWVDPSTHRAREHFEAEVSQRAADPDPAMFELAHRRKQLLALAVDTKQDGHTLSVLREAEKDARRASLSWRSRERVLLELWKWLLGYGERIGYPLWIGAGLLFVLGIGQVGWGHFWSRQWWAGWGHIDRFNELINFALPGIDAFGIDGVGGFWGVSAKVVSVLFVASAATAAIRVVKRGE